MSERPPIRFILPLALVGIAATSPARAQDETGPCGLVSIDQVAQVTGVRVTQTFPSGNLSAGAQCTYGGGDRPPTLIVSMARNSRESYESNSLFPNATPVDSVGIKATWVPTQVPAARRRSGPGPSRSHGWRSRSSVPEGDAANRAAA